MPEPGAPRELVESEELGDETIEVEVFAGDDEGVLDADDTDADADEVTT